MGGITEEMMVSGLVGVAASLVVVIPYVYVLSRHLKKRAARARAEHLAYRSTHEQA